MPSMLPLSTALKTSRGVRLTCSAKDKIQYGNDWYKQTKTPRRTVRDEIATRRSANLAANKGKDRKDLYTDNWDGSEYRGSPVNILSIILVVSVLTPLAGIIFAYATYGKLWG